MSHCDESLIFELGFTVPNFPQVELTKLLRKFIHISGVNTLGQCVVIKSFSIGYLFWYLAVILEECLLLCCSKMESSGGHVKTLIVLLVNLIATCRWELFKLQHVVFSIAYISKMLTYFRVTKGFNVWKILYCNRHLLVENLTFLYYMCCASSVFPHWVFRAFFM